MLRRSLRTRGLERPSNYQGVNWDSPLAVGLQHFWPLDGLSHLQNLITNQPLTINPTSGYRFGEGDPVLGSTIILPSGGSSASMLISGLASIAAPWTFSFCWHRIDGPSSVHVMTSQPGSAVGVRGEQFSSTNALGYSTSGADLSSGILADTTRVQVITYVQRNDAVSTGCELYVDGILVATMATGAAALTLSRIGNYADSVGFPIYGKFGHIQVWNRSLSPSEVSIGFDPMTRWDTLWVPSYRAYKVVTSAQGLTLAHQASTAAVFVPAVALADSLATGTIASSATIFAATVTGGDVALTTATIAASSTVFSPSISLIPEIRAVASAHELSGTADSLTVQITALAGETILLMVKSFFAAGTATSDIDGSMTEAGSPVGTDGIGRLQAFYIQDATAGLHTLTFTPGTNNHYISLYAMALSNVVASGGMNVASVERSQTSTTPSTGNITTTARCILIGMMANANGATGDSNESSGSGWTEQLDDRPGTSFHNRDVQYRVSDAGTYNSDWTGAANVSWQMKVVAFEASSGTGPLTLTLPVIASTSVAFAPAMGMALALPTISAASTINQPSIATTLIAASIASGSTTNAPSIAGVNVLALAVISATLVIFTPQLALNVQLPFITRQDLAFSDSFDGAESLSDDWTVYNSTALPNVSKVSNQYHSGTLSTNNQNLWFNASRGRADWKLVQFPGAGEPDKEIIAYNIGVGPASSPADNLSGVDFAFCGLIVHFEDTSDADYEFLVIGRRSANATLESKQTLNGGSTVADEGANALGTGVTHGDIKLLLRSDNKLRWAWRPVGGGAWTDLDVGYGTGITAGGALTFPTEYARVGIIAYTFNTPAVAFVGTCEALLMTNESSLMVFPPTVAAGPLTLSLPTIASAATQFAPTVTPGAVTLAAPTISSGSSIFSASAIGSNNLAVAHLSSTASLFGPTLIPGEVALSLPTIGSGEVTRAPSLEVGSVTLMPPTIALGSEIFAPTVVLTLALPTIASTATTFTSELTHSVSLPTIAATTAVFQPILTTGNTIASAHIVSTVLLMPATVTGGAVTIEAAHISSGAVLFTPTVTASQAVEIPHLSTTAVIFTPELTYSLTTSTLASTATLFSPATSTSSALVTATISSSAALFLPTITTGEVSLVGVHIPTTAVLFVPSLALPVTAPTLVSTAALFTPSLAFGITLPLVDSVTTIFTPTFTLFTSLPTLVSTSVVNVATVGHEGFFPPNVLVTDQIVAQVNHDQLVTLAYTQTFEG